MRISAPCLKCGIEKEEINLFQISINETGLYPYQCKNNHNNIVQLQAFKFELLFQSGLQSICDKYFLESILSLSASLERFYEFYIKIMLKSKGLDNAIIVNVFKKISNQSERQLGAFIILYSFLKKQQPPMLLDENTSIKFRNMVVHKGYLPNEREAIEYANKVYDIIRYYYRELLTEHNDAVFDLLSEEKKERTERNKDIIGNVGGEISTMSIPLAISHIKKGGDDFLSEEFVDCFNWVKERHSYEVS